MPTGSPGDNERLIEACLNKDAAAWSAFISKYSAFVSIAIESRLKRCGCAMARQDVEDIRQDVFALIWKGEKLRTVRNLKTIYYWLAIVSGNAAIEHARRMRRGETYKTVSIFDRLDEKELVELIPSVGPSPRDDMKREEISRHVESAMESLPEKERLIAKLNILYGKKYREIADMLNLPGGTVSSYLKRAKEKLKESLMDLK